MYSSTADREGLASLATKAEEAGAHNVAFSAKWLLADVEGCVNTLIKTDRLAEAVLFSQTYKPSLTADVVKQWKESLEKNKKGRVAKTIGAPGAEGDEELFPEWDEWLRLEKEGGTATDGDVEMENGNPVVETVEDEDEAAETAETDENEEEGAEADEEE